MCEEHHRENHADRRADGISIVVLVPSLTDRVPAGWKDRMPKINLGLDLQGGVFLAPGCRDRQGDSRTLLCATRTTRAPSP